MSKNFVFLWWMVLCVTVTVSRAAEPGVSPSSSEDARPRLLVLTDIGGDPDDTQSLVRLMLYTNEFRIEGLIASASGTRGELADSVTRADLIHQVVDAYGQVLPNLSKHASGWPDAAALKQKIKSGNPNRELKHVGETHDTEGSRWIIQCVDKGSAKHPLNIAIWGGQTDMAQSLWRVRADRGKEGLAEFIKKLRIYDIDDQDGIAAWINTEFPGLYYILAKAPPGQDKRLGAYRGIYLTGDQTLTSSDWINAHVKSRGPLGALYPMKTWTAPNPHSCMKEGDTPSWFFFLPLGGNKVEDPSQPGWGGQFEKNEAGVYRDLPATDSVDPRHSVSRWRSAFQADFSKRMSWCEP